MDRSNPKKKKPVSRGFLAVVIVILVVAVGVLGVSLYKLIGIDRSYKEANSLYDDLAAQMAQLAVEQEGQPVVPEGGPAGGTDGADHADGKTEADAAATAGGTNGADHADATDAASGVDGKTEMDAAGAVDGINAAAAAGGKDGTDHADGNTEADAAVVQTFTENTLFVTGTAREGSDEAWRSLYAEAAADPTQPTQPLQTAVPGFGTASIPWNFKSLHDKYPDAVGWIYQKDTMSYPVVQAEDNDKYLRNMINGEYNVAGTIFVDHIFDRDLHERYSIIYGHNMDDKSMFGTLTDYQEESWYRKHPVFELYAGNGMYRYHVYAAFKTEVDSRLFLDVKLDDNEFLDLIRWIDRQKLYETDAPKITKDSVVTVLSTCVDYPRDYDFRYVVVLVREEPLAKCKNLLTG